MLLQLAQYKFRIKSDIYEALNSLDTMFQPVCIHFPAALNIRCQEHIYTFVIGLHFGGALFPSRARARPCASHIIKPKLQAHPLPLYEYAKE